MSETTDLMALVQEWQAAERAYEDEGIRRGGSVLTATRERFLCAKRRLVAWTPITAPVEKQCE